MRIELNLAQRIALVIGGLAIVATLLYPPYDECGELICGGGFYWFSAPPVLSPDQANSPNEQPSLNWPVLGIELALIAWTTAAAVMLLDRGQTKREVLSTLTIGLVGTILLAAAARWCGPVMGAGGIIAAAGLVSALGLVVIGVVRVIQAPKFLVGKPH